MKDNFEELLEIRKINNDEILEALKGSKQLTSEHEIEYLYNNWRSYIGYTVITNKRKIICILDDDGQCCEDWEVEYKKENFDSQIKEGIKIILNVDDVEGNYDEGSAVELIVLESNIKHTIKLWNCHNGYYAHEYFIYDSSGEFNKIGLI